MFKFLKDKLRNTVSKFSKEIEDEIEVTEAEKEKKGLFRRLFGKKEEKKQEKKEIKEKEAEEDIKEKVEKIKEELKEEKISPDEGEVKEIKEEIKEVKKDIEELEKKSLIKKIAEKVTKKTISAKKFDELFWGIEEVMLENNIAVEVVEKIKEDLKKKLVDVLLPRKKIMDIIQTTLKGSIEELFNEEKKDLLGEISRKKPFVIVFFGVNGSGKTTTIAKFANLLQKNKKSVVMAAADTFRAAAIQQLEKHGDKLNVKVIKHSYGADAAAVAFDAVQHARAKGIDVVLIDTAGRQHSNVNLMDEMRKIVRVAKPDLKLFVGESITGNDCVEQAKSFDDIIGIDGIILSKADIDEKGGAAVSVSYVTGKPIMYLGTGQGYDDIKEFDSNVVIKGLGLA